MNKETHNNDREKGGCVKETTPDNQQIVFPKTFKTSHILTNTLITCKDFFLEHPPQQPKRDIAEYVENNWILVPKRFKSREEARSYVENGGEIFIRSEHPQEYNGASGLLSSYIVTQKWLLENMIWDDINIDNLSIISEEKLIETLKKDVKKKSKIYCDLLWQDIQKFRDNISYSFWEKIPWLNRSVVADSAILDRYHILAHWKNKDNEDFNSYCIIENGEILSETTNGITPDTKLSYARVIEQYEKVRNLDKFNPRHCPIMEFQTHKNQDYFLQYHRTRDSELSTFILDRSLEPGEIQAEYVRGITPPEGIIVETTTYYYTEQMKLEPEEASFDFHNNDTFTEIMSRRRKVNFEDRWLNTVSSLCKNNTHSIATRLFSSGITVWIQEKDVEVLVWKCVISPEKEHQKITLRVISDGRKAYVKLIS